VDLHDLALPGALVHVRSEDDDPVTYRCPHDDCSFRRADASLRADPAGTAAPKRMVRGAGGTAAGMSEYEASLRVPVPPDVLFTAASDPERVASWVPVVDEAERSGDDALTVHGEVGDREALWRAQEDQRRVEWGSRGEGSYAGWLQVYESGTRPDECEVVVHLSFLGDQPAAHGGRAAAAVEDELQQALRRLGDLARGAG
jgi:hypothetical protein